MVDKDNSWANDIVVSFGAFITGDETSKIKGLFGGYSIFGEIKTFYEYWDEYAKKETRDLHRYIIPLTDEQRNAFLKTLIEYLKAPKKFGNYKLLTNNCVTSITRLLNASGLGINNDNLIIPTNIGIWLDENELGPYSPLVIKAPKNLYNRLLNDDIYKQTFNELKSSYADNELYYIYSYFYYLKSEVLLPLREHIIKTKVTLDDSLQLKKFPDAIYQRCEKGNRSCFRNISLLEDEFLTQKEKVDSYKKRQLINSGHYSDFNNFPPYENIFSFTENRPSLKDIKRFKLIQIKNKVKLRVNFKKSHKRSSNSSHSKTIDYSLPLNIIDNSIYYNGVIVGEVRGGRVELSSVFIIPKLSNRRFDINLYKLISNNF